MRVIVPALLCLLARSLHAAPSAAEATLFDLANDERASRGVPALIWSEPLAQVARAHAADMAQLGASGHVSSDGATLVDRVNRADVRCARVAENVGTGPDVDGIHGALMDSPGHRANILDADLLVAGFGVLERDGVAWVAQDFAVPARRLSDAEAASAILDLVVPAWAPGIDPRLSRLLDGHAEQLARRDALAPDAEAHGACWEVAYAIADPSALPKGCVPGCAGAAAGVGVAWARTASRPLGAFFVAIAVRK